MFSDSTHPSVNVEFLMSLCKESTSVVCEVKEGDTICFIVKGKGPIAHRMQLFTKNVGEVDYNYAVSIARKVKKLPELFAWLLENKNWKEGEYIAKMAPLNPN